MKTINQTWVLILSAIFSLLLTGCGGSSDQASTIIIDDTPESEFYDAKSLALSEVKFDNINIEDDNLIDYFKIDLNATGTYTMYIESIPAGTNPSFFYTLDIEVYDSDENKIEGIQVHYEYTDSEANENGVFDFDAQSTGIYYLKIYRNRVGVAESITTAYEIHMEPSIANGLIQNDDFEFNDTHSQSAPIELATFQVDVNGTLNTVLHTDHYDWYELKDLQVGIYTLYVETKAGTVFRANGDSVVAKIYDPYENVYANFFMEIDTALDNTDKWTREVFEVTAQGSYFLKLEREYHLASNYSFKVLPSIANGYVLDANGEPNDEIHLAKDITLLDSNTTIDQSINITDMTDSDDWFKFTSDVTQVLNLKLETFAGTAFTTYGVQAQILNQYGVIIKTIPDNEYLLNAENENFTDSFSVVNGDDYYIHINRTYNIATNYRATIIK